jgi:hypothetical protein
MTLEKVYKYESTDGRFASAQKVYSQIKDTYTHVEFINTDGSVLHKQAVPAAWKTFGVYCGRANKMLARGISWEESDPKHFAGTGVASPRSLYNLKIDGATLVLTADKAIATITGTTASMGWTAGAYPTGLAKRADELLTVLSHKVLGEFLRLLEGQYIKEGYKAVLGSYTADIKSDTTIHEAKAAIACLMSAAGDDRYELLKDVTIIKTGLSEYQDWFSDETLRMTPSATSCCKIILTPLYLNN